MANQPATAKVVPERKLREALERIAKLCPDRVELPGERYDVLSDVGDDGDDPLSIYEKGLYHGELEAKYIASKIAREVLQLKEIEVQEIV